MQPLEYYIYVAQLNGHGDLFCGHITWTSARSVDFMRASRHAISIHDGLVRRNLSKNKLSGVAY